MEISPTRAQDMRDTTHHHHHHHHLHPNSPLNSPKGNNINGEAGGGGGVIHNSAANTGGGIVMDIPAGTPLTPKSISRSEPNPYPTTFVQADTSNFKQVVQMLTGSSETVTKKQQQQSKQPSHHQSDSSSQLPSSKSVIPPIRAPPKRSQQQQGFKLYERRNHSHLKNSLIINTLVPGLGGVPPGGGFSPRNNKPAEILSPSMLDFPKLALSPVTPLVDPFNNNSSGSGSSPSLCSSSSSSSEEERAIAEKGFYLHPSPMNTPRGAEPQLLPLFPVTSPRVSGASS
ncbi:hypothetical protein CDL15_Pgr002418 [Punica granatum]|nr:hypothetical protein CDL15_Pgr002418 [Punica granatum]